MKKAPSIVVLDGIGGKGRSSSEILDEMMSLAPSTLAGNCQGLTSVNQSRSTRTMPDKKRNKDADWDPWQETINNVLVDLDEIEARVKQIRFLVTGKFSRRSRPLTRSSKAYGKSSKR